MMHLALMGLFFALMPALYGAEDIEAGTLGTVTATAALYDPSLGSANGCDPDGCTAALTRVSLWRMRGIG